jgi:hypothetical protein
MRVASEIKGKPAHKEKSNMNSRVARRAQSILPAAMAMLLGIACVSPARGQSTNDKPYMVEWVYKVKWGYADEFWQLFKKYQIATLNREKELGYVTSYTVYRPGLHAWEDSRWEYRIVITYKNISSSGHGSEVEKQLFPDQATMKREENRRWELTEGHYDLPIHTIDPNGDGTE